MAQKSIYQIKVTLKDSHPPIWRRIQAPGDITLYRLHQILQVAMGWGGGHLHNFMINGEDFGDPEDDEFGFRGTRNEKRFRLEQVVSREGDRFTYIYDFGDDWEHTLLIEKIMPPQEGVQYPICIKGKRACPPEDVGGTWGYEGFLDAYFDTNNKDHESSVEWLGEGFDPEAFDLDAVNARLRQLRGDGKQAALPTDSEELVLIVEDELEDEDDDLWTPAWEAQLPEEYLQIFEDLPFRQDVITFLTYLKDHKVTGTKSTGNLPLKAVREIVKNMKLLERAGEDLPEYRSEEDVWPLYFIHVLTSGAGLVDGGASQQWILTDLGERFLNAPAINQISHLAYNWYLDTQGNAILPDVNDLEMAAEDSPIIKLDAVVQMPVQESFTVDSLVPQILGIPDQTWQEIKETDLGTFMRLSTEIMVLVPLASFGIMSPEFDSNASKEEEHNLVSVRLTPFGKELLTSIQDDAIDEF